MARSPSIPEASGRYARGADRDAINTAIATWGRAVDRREWNLIQTIFHADAIDHHGSFEGTVSQLVEWLKNRHRSILRSTHFLSPSLIEFAGGDRAVSETGCLGFQVYAPSAADGVLRRFGLSPEDGAAGQPIEIHARVRYLDLFERREDREWRIARRVTVFDHVEAKRNCGSEMNSLEGWTVGRRDADDPLWRIRREAGISSIA